MTTDPLTPDDTPGDAACLDPLIRALVDRVPVTAGGSFPVLDPSTGALIVEVPRVGPAEIRKAVDRAAEMLPVWARTPSRRRSDVLRGAFVLMLDELEPVALLMSLEMGKTRADARAEVRYAAEFFRWFSEEAVRIRGELRTAPSGSHRILTIERPVGVALLLTPWNFPAAMATRKLAPALAAGCTAILKPAEDTPLTALYLADLLHRAGLPPGVATVLTTDRPGELVEHALADPRIRKVSFTGSTPVGRQLLRHAAERITNTSLELGGNGPFVVLDDADLDAAVEGAVIAKMRNGGQACTAANRFLVQASVAGEFTQRLAARMAALRLGPAADEGTELGPLVNAPAGGGRRSRRGGRDGRGPRVHGRHRSRPARLVLPGHGARRRPPRLSALGRGDFGPVAPVITIADEDDAVTLANAGELGLAGYVYSRDLGRALAVAERLECGMVGVNRGVVSDPAAPFGGWKQSGLGREGGIEGIHEYLETTYLAAAW